MSRRSLSTHAVALSGASATGQFVMLVVFAMLGREVGPARLGVVSAAMAVAVVLSGLIDFGANALWTRDLSSGRLSGAEYAVRSFTKIAVGILASLVLTVVALLILPLRGYWGVGAILTSWVIAQTIQVALRAELKNVALAAALVLERLVLLAAYVGLARLLAPDTAFYLAYLTGAVAGAAYAWRATSPKYRVRPAHLRLRDAWRDAKYFGASAWLVTLQSMDVPIAAAAGGTTVAGIYGAVNRWTQPIALATNTFSALLIPVAARASSAREAWLRIRPAMWLPAASMVLSLAMAVLADRLVTFVMGEAFQGSVVVLQVLAVATGIVALNQPLAGVLQARGRDRYVAGALAVAVLTQLALLLPLVLLIGATGLALANLIAQVLLLGALGSPIVTRRHLWRTRQKPPSDDSLPR